MVAVIEMFFNFIGSIFGLLLSTTFIVGQLTVSIGSVIFAILVTVFVINTFWKGAHA